MEMQGILDLSSAQAIYSAVYPKHSDGSVAVQDLKTSLIGYLMNIYHERYRQEGRVVDPSLSQQLTGQVDQIINASQGRATWTSTKPRKPKKRRLLSSNVRNQPLSTSATTLPALQGKLSQSRSQSTTPARIVERSPGRHVLSQSVQDLPAAVDVSLPGDAYGTVQDTLSRKSKNASGQKHVVDQVFHEQLVIDLKIEDKDLSVTNKKFTRSPYDKRDFKVRIGSPKDKEA